MQGHSPNSPASLYGGWGGGDGPPPGETQGGWAPPGETPETYRQYGNCGPARRHQDQRAPKHCQRTAREAPHKALAEHTNPRNRSMMTTCCLALPYLAFFPDFSKFRNFDFSKISKFRFFEFLIFRICEFPTFRVFIFRFFEFSNFGFSYF